MHFIIPLLILLVLYPRVDKRLAIGLALLTFVPDFDFFIDYTHRFLFHNIFFVVILSSIIYFFSKSFKIFIISLYYLISHLILDLTVGAIALFWPVYNKLIQVVISLNSNWIFEFKIGTMPLSKIEEHMISSPSYYFTQEGIIVLFALMIMLTIKYKKEIIKFFKK